MAAPLLLPSTRDQITDLVYLRSCVYKKQSVARNTAAGKVIVAGVDLKPLFDGTMKGGRVYR